MPLQPWVKLVRIIEIFAKKLSWANEALTAATFRTLNELFFATIFNQA